MIMHNVCGAMAFVWIQHFIKKLNFAILSGLTHPFSKSVSRIYNEYFINPLKNFCLGGFSKHTTLSRPSDGGFNLPHLSRREINHPSKFAHMWS